MSDKLKVGIIGGSWLQDKKNILDDGKEKSITDALEGPPSSSKLIVGQHKSAHVDCVLLVRDSCNPSNVNYRAEINALKDEKCTHVIVISACSSLKKDIRPGHFVIPSDFIDRTTQRKTTFYDGTSANYSGLCHIPMTKPFCPNTSKILAEICATEYGKDKCCSEGTVVTIEGPRFSTVAEGEMFRQLGGHVVNMTTCPEVILAKEVGLSYAVLAHVSGYEECVLKESEQDSSSSRLCVKNMDELWKNCDQTLKYTAVIEKALISLSSTTNSVVDANQKLVTDSKCDKHRYNF